MEHIHEILNDIFEKLSNKEVFLPLVIANSIICYKLAHNNEQYWESFGEQVVNRDISTLQDMYLFFIDFLPSTSQFKHSYKRKIDHLKEFDEFLQELFFKQKYYYKNPDQFHKHLSRYIVGIPNPHISTFTQDMFEIAAKIRFS